jgi:outer membrane receptor protein involved in Fe transport
VSPTLLNEFRAGFARNDEYVAPQVNGYQYLQQLGIQGIPTGPGGRDIPAFNITGIQSTEMGSSSYNIGTDFQFTDNLSWIKGSHSLKFGTDIIRDEVSLYGNTDVYGQYNFTGVYSGFAYADFLLGLPETTAFNYPQPSDYLHGTAWSFYAQDQWKATRRLTLDFGLRYELAGPYYEKNGLISTYDPTLQAIVVPDNGISHINPLFPKNIPIVTATKANYPDPTLQKYNTHNFYPRIGFAYQLTSDGKTVLRGAYGIYGDTIYGTLSLSKGGGPFSGSESFYNSVTTGTSETPGTALFTLQNPFVPAAGLVAPFQSANFWNPNLTVPYLQQWNVTLQRQIGSVGLTLGYVGSHNVGLLWGRNINQPHPSTTPFSNSELPNQSFSTIYEWDNGANDEYNALQASATKTVGRNLIVNASYTWARDLTDSADNDWITGPAAQNAFARAPEWGNNPYNPAQRFYAAAIYSLPVGKGQRFLKNTSGWTDQLLGGWRTAYVLTLMTGQWFTPSFDGFDPSNTNNYGGRPDRIAGAPLYPSNRTINDWFNANAFEIPGCPNSNPVCADPANVGRFGNAAPLQISTPATKNLDFTLMKDFHVTETKRLQFQAIFANAFNHPAFGYPGADISATSSVGVITGTAGNYLQGSSPQRTINFALRFIY